MTKEDILIKVHNLKKEYRVGNDVVAALRGISLELTKTEFAILYGPSGSGKTTLLNLLGLIDIPTGGEIFIEGINTTKLHKNRLSEFRLNNIGFIFQKYYLLEELSAIENVFLPALAKGGLTRLVLSRAGHILKMVGLGQRLKHRPRHLSEGERQRVAIARSLINEPKILLCDEPTASLDAENSQIVLDILAKINSKKSVTIFLVTHDERQLSYADNVYNLTDGIVTQKTSKL